MKPSSRSSQPKSSVKVLEPSQWLERYGDQFYNYAFARLNNHEFSEEAVQETFMAAVIAIDEFEGKSSEQTWLFSILKRKIVDVVRREWKPKAKSSLADEVNPDSQLFLSDGNWRYKWSSPEHCPVESKEFLQIVQRCLGRLPSNQASVFVLRVLEEKTPQEICKELEITPANLGIRLHRARLGLARCVSQQMKK